MRSARKAYYRLVSRLSGIDIPIDVGEFQLIDRKVLEALLQHEDHYPYIRGMIANCGFRTKGIPYVWRARTQGLLEEPPVPPDRPGAERADLVHQRADAPCDVRRVRDRDGELPLRHLHA